MDWSMLWLCFRYIATQGPLATTCIDFWYMTWECQSTLIIMLTTIVERGRIKCHKYWPDVGDTVEVDMSLKTSHGLWILKLCLGFLTVWRDHCHLHQWRSPWKVRVSRVFHAAQGNRRSQVKKVVKSTRTFCLHFALLQTSHSNGLLFLARSRSSWQCQWIRDICWSCQIAPSRIHDTNHCPLFSR